MINLEDGWRITTDGTTFILQRYMGTYKNSKGIMNERFDSFKYYSTLSQAVQAYLRVRQCKYIAENEMSLTEALTALQKQNEEIISALNAILHDDDKVKIEYGKRTETDN